LGASGAGDFQPSLDLVALRTVSLLRLRAARALWLGQVTSVTGDRLYNVAMTWTALAITRSPLGVGLVSLAGSVPFLVSSLVSGTLADHRDGLRLARVVDLCRAVIMLVLPVSAEFGPLRLGELITVAAVMSALEAFFLPSLQASLPRLVEPGLPPGLVSLLDSTDRLGRIFGAGAVGVLVAMIPEIQLFSINAATFAISAFCLTMVLRSAGRWTSPMSSGGRKWRLLAAGWRALWEEPTLRRATVLRCLANIAWPAFTVTIPFLIDGDFHLGIGAYGLSLAAFGLGNLIGNIASGWIGTDRPLRTTCLAWAGVGAGFAVIGVAPSYPTLLCAVGVTGVCTPLANVIIDAQIAVRLPRDLLARAFSAQRFLVVAAGTIGLPAFGLIAQATSPAPAMVIAGAMITGTAGLVGISGRRPRAFTRSRPVSQSQSQS